MVKHPEIAVILAAFNGRKWIEEQVASILSQTQVNPKLFISVDASVDGTQVWVAELAKHSDSVVMLPYGGVFGGAAANFFHLIREVDFSGFDAVALADQDDIWLPDKLARAWEQMASGACEVYSSSVTALWEDGRTKHIDKAQPQKRLDYFFEAAGPGCTYVFSRAAMLSFQHFVLEAGQRLEQVEFHDWLAYAYCRSRGMPWLIDGRPGMYYRQHADNQIGVNAGWSAWGRRWRLLRSQWYRQQVRLIADLVAPDKSALLGQRRFLMKNFWQLRRRSRDAWLLLLMVGLGVY